MTVRVVSRTILHGLVSDLETHALLRVHGLGFIWSDLKERSIESLRVTVHEMSSGEVLSVGPLSMRAVALVN